MESNYPKRVKDLAQGIQRQIGKLTPEERATLVKELEAIKPRLKYLNEKQKGMMDRLKALEKEIEDLENRQG